MPVTQEIGDVEREQLSHAVDQHRRDDVGVVDLPPSVRHLPPQCYERLRDNRSVLADLEVRSEPFDILEDLFRA